MKHYLGKSRRFIKFANINSKFHAEMLNRTWDIWNFLNQCFQTRMHSSRMSTGRTLTVFRWRPPPKIWRNPPPKKTPPKNLEEPPQKETPPKIWKPPLKIWRNPPRKFGGTLPPPCGQTHACENITLAKTSFRPVKIGFYTIFWKCSYMKFTHKIHMNTEKVCIH